MIAPLQIPRLETERLILRGPEESDFPIVAAFMASPRARHVGGPITDEYAAWRAFLAGLGHWALRGYGFFTLELRETGLPVGRVGVVYHVMWPEPELGWQLFEGYEGAGFAFEAARQVRDWSYRSCGLGPLVSIVAPDNTRSIALTERLGAVMEGEMELLGGRSQVYRHPDPAVAAP